MNFYNALEDAKRTTGLRELTSQEECDLLVENELRTQLSLEACYALQKYEYSRSIKLKGVISKEQEVILTDTLSLRSEIPGLELYNSIAKEGLINNALFFLKIYEIIKYVLDNTEGAKRFLTFFDNQTENISKTKVALNKVKGKKTIKIKANKWMMVELGKSVTSGKQYLNEFKQMVDTLEVVNEMVAGLISLDFVAWVDFCKSQISEAGAKKFMKDRVEAMKSHVQKLERIYDSKPTSKNQSTLTTMSDNHLGLFKVKTISPVNEVLFQGAWTNFYQVSIERLKQFNLPDSFQDNMELDIDEKQCKELLELSQKLMNSVKKSNENLNRVKFLVEKGLTFIGLVSGTGLPGAVDVTASDNDKNLEVVINLSGVAIVVTEFLLDLLNDCKRVMNAISHTFASCNGPVFNLSHGHVKQAMYIVEKYLEE